MWKIWAYGISKGNFYDYHINESGCFWFSIFSIGHTARSITEVPDHSLSTVMKEWLQCVFDILSSLATSWLVDVWYLSNLHVCCGKYCIYGIVSVLHWPTLSSGGENKLWTQPAGIRRRPNVGQWAPDTVGTGGSDARREANTPNVSDCVVKSVLSDVGIYLGDDYEVTSPRSRQVAAAERGQGPHRNVREQLQPGKLTLGQDGRALAR